MRKVFMLVAFAAVLGTSTATAAPCAGFTDIPDSSSFCSNVQWVKNRGVTLGCTATTYCPDAPVTRLAMAAFLNRLGTAQLPHYYARSETFADSTIVTGGVVCGTPGYPVTGYPRVLTAVGSVSHTASTAQTVGAVIVFSLDDGQTWNDLDQDATTVATNIPGGWATQTTIGRSGRFDPGMLASYGIKVTAAAVSEATCHITVRYDAYDSL